MRRIHAGARRFTNEVLASAAAHEAGTVPGRFGLRIKRRVRRSERASEDLALWRCGPKVEGVIG